MAWSQPEDRYIERQQRMARLHTLDLVEAWLDLKGVPGAAIAVVEGSHTLLLEGFGSADTLGNVPVDPNTTVFRAGNLVRILTATAALQLADQGVLELDSDLSQRSGLASLVHDSLGPVTPTALLLHTAGIDQRTIATRARTPADLLSLGEYLEHRMPPQVRPPGIISVPSDHGYALVGRLIEQLSRDDFESQLESALLGPLEMASTTVTPATVPRDRVAIGHRLAAGGPIAMSPDYSQTVPASTLWTTAADMAAWMRVVLGDGFFADRRILSEASLARLLERQFTHHDSLPGRTLAFEEGNLFAPRELSLAATDNGFSAVMVLLPARRVGLFAAFNSEIDFWSLVYQVLGPFGAPHDDETSVAGDFVAPLQKNPSGYWQDAAVAHDSAEKLLALVRQDRIRWDDAGVLIWRAREFAPAGPDCFQESATRTRLCFADSPGARPIAVVGDLVLERLGWYETRPVQILLWIAFAALFLAAGWPRAALPIRHSALRPDDPFSPRWPSLFARLAAALNFVFIAALAIVLATLVRTGSRVLLYEIPLLVRIVLGLPLIAAALSVAAAVGLVPVWRHPQSTLDHRLRVSLLVLGLLAFLPFLESWNLLGFHI